MKKIFALLIAITAISCSSDDNDAVNDDNGLHDPYTGSVVGEWKTVAVAIDNEAINLDCDLEAPFEDNYYFVFHSDNTMDVYDNCLLEFDDEGNFDPTLPHQSGTYETNGNTLTLKLNGQTGKAHMVDYLEDDMLEFRFTIGSSGLFYNYHILVEERP